MFKYILIILAVFAPLCVSFIINRGSRIHSNTFCRLADKQCSKRNAPYVYQCGLNLCSRDGAECERFQIVEMIANKKSLTAFVTNPTFENNQNRLQENFMRLERRIKKCPQVRTPYEWLPSEVCVRERNCFRSPRETNGKSKNQKRTNCPCPVNMPYVCGSQKRHIEKFVTRSATQTKN